MFVLGVDRRTLSIEDEKKNSCAMTSDGSQSSGDARFIAR
jgi:hypothetical protein